MDKQTLTDEAYIKALQKLKGRDRIGVLSELLGLSTGAGGGVLVGGPVAGLLGAKTIFGSAFLGQALGGIFVATTPVHIPIICAIGSGGLVYGIVKLARSGGKNDEIRKQEKNKIEAKLNKNKNIRTYKKKYSEFITKLQKAIKKNKIDQQVSNQLIEYVEKGYLSVNIAINRIEKLVQV